MARANRTGARASALLSLALIFESCSGLQQPPVDVRESLRLTLVQAPATIDAGSYVELVFALVNESPHNLVLCADGVTTHLWADTPRYIRPLKLYGATTDGGCALQFTLAPGEARNFNERVWVWEDLPDSTPKLIGAISVTCRTTGGAPCLTRSPGVESRISVQARPGA